MIQHLSIENYILIQNIHVDLTNGFNVFTGETGSGKSMLVDAINFVMGQRSTPTIVGKHGDSTRVELLLWFSLNHPIHEKLVSSGFTSEDDGSILITRELFKDGRNVSRINGRVATLSSVRKLLEDVIDIHSQHETQILLNAKHHLKLLDTFAENDEIKDNYTKAFDKYITATKALETFKNSEINPNDVKDAIQKLKQLQSFNPGQEDYENVLESLDSMDSYERKQVLYDSLLELLKRDNNVLDRLYEGIELFEKLGNTELLEQFRDAYFNLEDVGESVVKLENNNNFDFHEYERLQERLYGYQQIIRKYGSLENVLNSIAEFEALIKKSEHYDDLLIDHENDVTLAYSELEKQALLLRESRNNARESLRALIEKQLNDLLLENARFDVLIEEKVPGRDGFDSIQFVVSMNKGESLAPLDNVASGGELSRLMLGMKVILSDIFGISSLIFDEIDTGVSGRAGFKIGEKMKRLGEKTQVITISHLSSVAACATNHYAITKSQDDDQTVTSILKVEGDRRVEELALIMSGSVTDASKQAAKELLLEGQNV